MVMCIWQTSTVKSPIILSPLYCFCLHSSWHKFKQKWPHCGCTPLRTNQVAVIEICLWIKARTFWLNVTMKFTFDLWHKTCHHFIILSFWTFKLNVVMIIMNCWDLTFDHHNLISSTVKSRGYVCCIWSPLRRCWDILTKTTGCYEVRVTLTFDLSLQNLLSSSWSPSTNVCQG